MSREKTSGNSAVDLNEESRLAEEIAHTYYRSMATEFERLATIPLDELSKTERERWNAMARRKIKLRRSGREL